MGRTERTKMTTTQWQRAGVIEGPPQKGNKPPTQPPTPHGKMQLNLQVTINSNNKKKNQTNNPFSNLPNKKKSIHAKKKNLD